MTRVIQKKHNLPHSISISLQILLLLSCYNYNTNNNHILVVNGYISSSINSNTFVYRSFHSKTKSSNGNDNDSGNDDNEIKINPLVSNVKISKTIEVFGKVKEMESNGIEVTSLCVGEPDFPPPKAVLEAATSAITNAKTKYTAVTGIVELRQAIAKDLQTRKSTSYNPNTEILIGNGAKQNVYQGMLATCGENDVVLIPAPYWPSYPEMATLVGSKAVIIDTLPNDGYLLSPNALKKALHDNPNTRMIILCNPSNPTGSVYSKTQLQELATVLLDYPKVIILADEIYERLTYDNIQHTSFASIDRMFNRTITINGFSKAYAMTGFRLGYSAAPQYLTKACTTIQSQLTSCAGSISQIAGLAALTLVSEDEMNGNIQIMTTKRDYVLSQLKTIPGVIINFIPQGAFYILVNLSNFYNGDDTQLCLDLLERKQLALVPGSSFGAPGTVRISYATSMEELEIAMMKLGEFLADL